MDISGFELQNNPKIYFTSIPGKWLLNRATPSWRIENPQLGFQRLVKEDRARQIALTVLDQKRTFPNAIVLATDKEEFDYSRGKLNLPDKVKFLVVDGQHRLYAQKFSEYEANYACLIHMGLSEVNMANLFLEINDNQKRVPSSLRWDLVRLVRPEDDPTAIAASEIVYSLSTEKTSPMYQRIDLTGEQNEIQIKQGSIPLLLE
jgi:DGQHR domain-containing protein